MVPPTRTEDGRWRLLVATLAFWCAVCLGQAAPTQQSLNVRDFGAKGDGKADDTAAFQQAVTAALAVRGEVYVPTGRYRITKTIDCNPVWGEHAGRGVLDPGKILSRSGMGLRGEHTNGSIIEPDGAFIVFRHSEYFHVSNLWLRQKPAQERPGARGGIAFATPPNIQAAFCTFSNLKITDFDIGIWHRFTLFNSYRDLLLGHNRCGLRMARNADPYDQANPPPEKGWNSGSKGWFHNVNVIDNVMCEGGEVGIWAASMCTEFRAVTCQNQRLGDGADNLILPKGAPGTGILIEAGRDGSRRGKPNRITSFYAEFTDRPICIRDNTGVVIDASFTMGGDGAKVAIGPCAIEVDNSTVWLRAHQISQRYRNLIVARNKSTVHGMPSGGWPIESRYKTDESSVVLPFRAAPPKTRVYRLALGGKEEGAFTVPEALVPGTFYRLSVDGVAGEAKAAEWVVYSPATGPATIVKGGDASKSVKVGLAKGKLRIECLKGAPQELMVFVESMGAGDVQALKPE